MLAPEPEGGYTERPASFHAHAASQLVFDGNFGEAYFRAEMSAANRVSHDALPPTDRRRMASERAAPSVSAIRAAASERPRNSDGFLVRPGGRREPRLPS
jgi:hypothetical protein